MGFLRERSLGPEQLDGGGLIRVSSEELTPRENESISLLPQYNNLVTIEDSPARVLVLVDRVEEQETLLLSIHLIWKI